MLDLDVGFMDNPLKLLDLALNDSSVDVLVQVIKPYIVICSVLELMDCLIFVDGHSFWSKKDISFVMHRDVIRWRTWFIVPLPNIGRDIITLLPPVLALRIVLRNILLSRQ